MARSDSATSMVLSDVGELRPREFDVPDVDDGGMLLDVEMTSVCGTDIGIYTGESYHNTFPLVFGHEVVGCIADGDPETLNRVGVEVGDRIIPEPYIPCYECHYCQTGNYHMCDEGRCYGVTISADVPPHLWGGYGEYMYLDPNTRAHPVPDGVPAEAACLGTVVGNGVRWILTKGDVDPQEDIVIVGPGAQGLASVIVADEAGADRLVLAGLSSDDQRLRLGESFGATDVIHVDEGDPVEEIATLTDGDGPEVVVVTAPSSKALQLAVDVVAPLGKIVLPGIMGTETELDTDRLVHDEIQLLGGRGQAHNVERAMAILERRADDVAAINTHTFPVWEAETAIERQLPGDEFDHEIIHAALHPE
ncbi:zinc-dependent alcohol dehydrogenase [Halegenticoccus soli]|uniref:zinc-dependent alcohol dehydrogenase n=1 Tax=Halegenticoccus soli TaxID=1985678 RepID=UPI000C6D79D8|nr:alcohol dehydrogenase catalytic domain-containing protein [Halegenticoccus soli]